MFASDTVVVALISCTGTIVAALIAGGYFFRSRVTRPIARIETATNHIKDGEPTLIQRVNLQREEFESYRKADQAYKRWIVVYLAKLAKQVGMPPSDGPEEETR